ncbi:hypothetical protein FRB94_002396, partial [Tulasnella sp. JGI-2019a]
SGQVLQSVFVNSMQSRQSSGGIVIAICHGTFKSMPDPILQLMSSAVSSGHFVNCSDVAKQETGTCTTSNLNSASKDTSVTLQSCMTVS